MWWPQPWARGQNEGRARRAGQEAWVALQCREAAGVYRDCRPVTPDDGCHLEMSRGHCLRDRSRASRRAGLRRAQMRVGWRAQYRPDVRLNGLAIGITGPQYPSRVWSQPHRARTWQECERPATKLHQRRSSFLVIFPFLCACNLGRMCGQQGLPLRPPALHTHPGSGTSRQGPSRARM